MQYKVHRSSHAALAVSNNDSPWTFEHGTDVHDSLILSHNDIRNAGPHESSVHF